jgi:glycosyltransferase involved in cell wall biosynthesis
MIINLNGPVGQTGYGRIITFMAPALKAMGHKVHVLPAYQEEVRVADEKLYEFMNNIDEEQLNADVNVRLSVANPADAISFYGKKRVFWTMLENDKLPPFWVKSLNTMDQVWALSHWGKQVFENSGVKKDVKIVPAGVDLNIFNPWREPMVPRTDKFRFLCVGKYEKRKGYDLLLKAYCEEFKQNEKVEMIVMADSIKLFDPNFSIFREMVNLRLPADRAELQIVEGMLPKYSDMGRLYTSADCFVSPTRGEGWNLPLCEAMACGLPSIVTNWSAHTEFANEKNAYMLNDYKMVPSDQKLAQIFLQFGKWAEPSIKELREKMRYVFDNQAEAKKLGEFASKDMSNWTWDCAAKKAVKALEELK